MKRFLRPSTIILATLFVLLAFGIRWLLWPNKAIIQNSSDWELQDVTLVMTDLDGRVFLNKHVRRLAPGEKIVYRHGHNDSRAELHYTHRGKSRTQTFGYIDLWTGESAVFLVEPGGSARGSDEERWPD